MAPLFINPDTFYGRMATITASAEPFEGTCGTSRSSMFFSISSSMMSNLSAAFDLDAAMLRAEIIRTHRLFVESLARVQPLNPLPILMRAVNAVRCRFQIHQPCWRAARWKSLT